MTHESDIQRFINIVEMHMAVKQLFAQKTIIYLGNK